MIVSTSSTVSTTSADRPGAANGDARELRSRAAVTLAHDADLAEKSIDRAVRTEAENSFRRPGSLAAIS